MKNAKNSMKLVSFGHQILITTVTIMPAKKDLARLWTEKRMCEDCRPLNLVTPQDMYPMPILKDCLITLETQTSSQLWI
jgi:hypothetical protein